ncbi:MAG: gliding motility-associated C-terminal domain-containing protein, partial [Saprospiraceae bacterium]
VMIEDADGCTFEDEIFISEPAELTLGIEEEVSISLGTTIDLDPQYANLGAIDTVLWTPLEYLVFDTTDLDRLYPETSPIMYYTTNFEVTVVDTFGCIVREEIQVLVDKDRPIYIPNAFSPNDTPPNDEFIILSAIDDPSIAQVNFFRIFNRWGELVFESEGLEGEGFQPNDPEHGWDGTFKGKDVNPGVYIYVAEVEFIDGFKILYKGDVTLFR